MRRCNRSWPGGYFRARSIALLMEQQCSGLALKPFRLLVRVMDDLVLVPEGKVCSTILQLYNEEGIVVEPAGALNYSCL